MKGAAAVKLTAQTGQDLEFISYTGYDEETDIAVLDMRWGDYRADSNWEPLYLATYRPSIGQHVYVAGHPDGLGFTLSEGMVSSLYQRSIQISAPISHGSSGSPVMDESGRVVGVAVGIDSHGQNLNFAIPAAAVEPTLRPNMPCPKTADYRHYEQPKVAARSRSAIALARKVTPSRIGRGRTNCQQTHPGLRLLGMSRGARSRISGVR